MEHRSNSNADVTVLFNTNKRFRIDYIRNPFVTCVGREDGPVPMRLGCQLLEQGEIVVPGDLCKRPLHNSLAGPRLGESPHIFKVARREAGHLREAMAKVGGQPVDDLRSPSCLILPLRDLATDLPIEKNHFVVDGVPGADLCRADAFLDVSLASSRRAVPARAQSPVGWRTGEERCGPTQLPRFSGPLCPDRNVV